MSDRKPTGNNNPGIFRQEFGTKGQNYSGTTRFLLGVEGALIPYEFPSDPEPGIDAETVKMAIKILELAQQKIGFSFGQWVKSDIMPGDLLRINLVNSNNKNNISPFGLFSLLAPPDGEGRTWFRQEISPNRRGSIWFSVSPLGLIKGGRGSGVDQAIPFVIGEFFPNKHDGAHTVPIHTQHVLFCLYHLRKGEEGQTAASALADQLIGRVESSSSLISPNKTFTFNVGQEPLI